MQSHGHNASDVYKHVYKYVYRSGTYTGEVWTSTPLTFFRTHPLIVILNSLNLNEILLT